MRQGGPPPPALGNWTVWVPVLAAAVLAVLLLWAYRRLAARHRLRQAFRETADRLGLGPTEQAVLASLVNLAGLRRPGDVYVSAEAFERGAGRLLRDEAVLGMAGAQRRALEAVVESLRLKLGFSGAGARESAPPGVPLHAGDEVWLVLARGPSAGQARVVAVEGRQVTVLSAGPFGGRPGESCVLRRAHDGLQWEFSAAVVAVADTLAVVRLVGEPRYVNLRRFVRASTQKPAYVARYPFVRAGASAALPQFVPGLVTEIAGPGLRIAAPLEAEVGDRVLTVAAMQDGKVVQGVGEVRRIVGSAPTGRTFAVELIGLVEREIGELVRETNAAARRAEAIAAAGAASPAE